MRVAVALIVGLVIGAEREQRLAESPTVHKSAGIRTFAIVALLGAV
ncbi:MAG: MgtC/SapB family protein, partial [Deltaproteobacteria bacterium]